MKIYFQDNILNQAEYAKILASVKAPAIEQIALRVVLNQTTLNAIFQSRGFDAAKNLQIQLE